jgi:polysaccharide export outer membrane protein
LLLVGQSGRDSFGQPPPPPPRAEVVASPPGMPTQTPPGWPAERQWVNVPAGSPQYAGPTYAGPPMQGGPVMQNGPVMYGPPPRGQVESKAWKMGMGTAGWAAPAGVGPPGFTAQPEFPQGEYVERQRSVHTPSYRLRPDDHLEFVYRLTRNESLQAYRVGIGDKLKVESISDPTLNRDVLTVLPDGTVTLKLLGQIQAAGRTVDDLREDLEKRYTQYYRVPGMTVTPLEVNTKLEDLRATVVARFGNGGQVRDARVTPEGTIQLPVIGSIPVQGLTIDELKREIDQRYAVEIDGIEVMPVLVQRAPRFVYVLGEVRNPGRYSLEGPTSAMQAISLAGSWTVGANMYHVVVFRRDDHWNLMATRLNLWDPAYGNTPHAQHDIWLGDSDVVIVPKMKVLVIDEYIDLYFTKGLYGVVPFNGVSVSMSKLSTL